MVIDQIGEEVAAAALLNDVLITNPREIYYLIAIKFPSAIKFSM